MDIWDEFDHNDPLTVEEVNEMHKRWGMSSFDQINWDRVNELYDTPKDPDPPTCLDCEWHCRVGADGKRTLLLVGLYIKGFTPEPCVRCDHWQKTGELLP